MRIAGDRAGRAAEFRDVSLLDTEPMQTVLRLVACLAVMATPSCRTAEDDLRETGAIMARAMDDLVPADAAGRERVIGPTHTYTADLPPVAPSLLKGMSDELGLRLTTPEEIARRGPELVILSLATLQHRADTVWTTVVWGAPTLASYFGYECDVHVHCDGECRLVRRWNCGHSN